MPKWPSKRLKIQNIFARFARVSAFKFSFENKLRVISQKKKKNIKKKMGKKRSVGPANSSFFMVCMPTWVKRHAVKKMVLSKCKASGKSAKRVKGSWTQDNMFLSGKFSLYNECESELITPKRVKLIVIKRQVSPFLECISTQKCVVLHSTPSTSGNSLFYIQRVG